MHHKNLHLYIYHTQLVCVTAFRGRNVTVRAAIELPRITQALLDQVAVRLGSDFKENPSAHKDQETCPCVLLLLLFVTAQGICPRCTSACRHIVIP
jgi:hypothetical protein